MIKRSLAYRAKYRAGQGPGPTIQVFGPALAVPHPMNRAGDPVKSIRTLELAGAIAKDGCDTIEANSNAVAVFNNPTIGFV